MNIETIMKLDHMSESLKEDVRAFVSFCVKLDEIAQQETDAILSRKRLDKMTISREKVEMLESFEHEAQRIFARIEADAPHNLALQNALLAEIKSLQNTLKVNTGLHLHMICNSPVYNDMRQGVTCH
ncbi:MAG: hypothetical protein LRY36_00505 [Alphaproteobacteria bacterium]|nr:hypothetical protein [Alphaproteobacteria bacterium]